MSDLAKVLSSAIIEQRNENELLKKHIDSMRTDCLKLEAIREILAEPFDGRYLPSENYSDQLNRIREVLGIE